MDNETIKVCNELYEAYKTIDDIYIEESGGGFAGIMTYILHINLHTNGTEIYIGENITREQAHEKAMEIVKRCVPDFSDTKIRFEQGFIYL